MKKKCLSVGKRDSWQEDKGANWYGMYSKKMSCFQEVNQWLGITIKEFKSIAYRLGFSGKMTKYRLDSIINKSWNFKMRG